MMSYTVCLLICRETGRVLLVKKDRTDFAGRYNGVGGKLERCENPVLGAIREIREETGADVSGRVVKLGKLTIPYDCGKHDPQGCTLHYFTADVHEDEVSQQEGETESLTWWPVKSAVAIPACSDTFAGDGDLQYFINIAWNGFPTKSQPAQVSKVTEPEREIQMDKEPEVVSEKAEEASGGEFQC